MPFSAASSAATDVQEGSVACTRSTTPTMRGWGVVSVLLAARAFAAQVRIIPGVAPPPKPAPVTASLLELKRALLEAGGACHQTTVYPFEYQLCPFQNVTQEVKHNEKEHWVLGVYEKWAADGAEVSSMSFTNGDVCNGNPRTVKVIAADVAHVIDCSVVCCR